MNPSYNPVISEKMGNDWQAAIDSGRTVYEIGTDYTVDPKYCNMALMAITAPSPDHYTYNANRVYIGAFHDSGLPEPDQLEYSLRTKEAILLSYTEALLWWLDNHSHSIDRDPKLYKLYQQAIEKTMNMLHEDQEILYKTRLIDRLFQHHAINRSREVLIRLTPETLDDKPTDHINHLAPFRRIFAQRLPRDHKVRALSILIDIATIQEGFLPENWEKTKQYEQWHQHSNNATRCLVGYLQERPIQDPSTYRYILNHSVHHLMTTKYKLPSTLIFDIAQSFNGYERYWFLSTVLRRQAVHDHIPNPFVDQQALELVYAVSQDADRKTYDNAANAKFFSEMYATMSDNFKKEKRKIDRSLPTPDTVQKRYEAYQALLE